MSEGKTPRRGLVDEALASWPAAGRSPGEWEESARAIEARLDSAAVSEDVSDEALLAPPLAASPDEVAGSAPTREGQGRMSTAATSRQRDWASLKELARMAETGDLAPTSSKRPSSPMFPEEEAAKPAEAPREDSGMIHLASMDARAEQAAPSPRSPAVAAPSSARVAPAAAKATPRPASRWLPWTGLAAAAAVAAGVFVGMHRTASAPPTAVAVAVRPTPAPSPAGTAAARPIATPIAPADLGVDPASLPQAAPAGGSSAPGVASKGGAAPAPIVAAPFRAASAAAAPAASPPDPALVAKVPAPPAAPTAGTSLEALMQQAAGVTPASAAAAAPDTPATPAAPGSVPLKPSLGAIQGALGAALPGARACLGPDDPISRASVTFGSDGSVQSVSVSGGAAGKPAEACIRAALMKARVAPFAQATFTAPATIRPN